MSLPAFGAEGFVPISPSRWLCIWITFAASAAVILSFCYLPLWGAIGACLICVSAAIRTARRDALLTATQSVVLLRFRHTGLDYQFRNGLWREGGNLGASFVSRWLSVVALRSTDAPRHRHIILMPDSLKGDAARQVRIWLKWSQHRES